MDEVTQAALLYLAKLLETNKDKTYSLWVSQEPLCKTTDAKLPGHCNVTSYSKMTVYCPLILDVHFCKR